MRYIALAAVALAAACFAPAHPASAQNRAWCTEPPIGAFGGLDCSYSSLAQCRATAMGTRLSCTQNPGPAWRALKERNRRERAQRRHGGSWSYHND